MTSVISVALCTYNGESYLREQLDSILSQTLLPSEVVVCDDASTDGTLEIIWEFRQRSSFPVVVVENPVNFGVCKNFNQAVGLCSGRIIAFADQDDVWEACKLERLMEAFSENPDCGYVFSNAELINEHGGLIGRDLWLSIGFNASEQSKYASDGQLNVILKRRGCNLVYGMSMAFRAKYIPILIPIESSNFQACSHDTWIALMLSAIGAYGVALSDVLVLYRQHFQQLAGGKPQNVLESLRSDRGATIKINEDLSSSLQRIALRLMESNQGSLIVTHAAEKLFEKARHLQARADCYKASTVKKLTLIFRELLSGRYGKYSGGMKSAFRDLFSI